MTARVERAGYVYLEATLTDPPDSHAAEATVDRVRTAVHQVEGADASVVFTQVFGFKGGDPGMALLCFVFLVALGIDYNIFLMSRVHEESKQFGTRRGALTGLAATGGVITSRTRIVMRRYMLLLEDKGSVTSLAWRSACWASRCWLSTLRRGCPDLSCGSTRTSDDCVRWFGTNSPAA